ncbi:MAG: hypothetical protein E6471_34620, partial [Bradyrhizobium sp.]|nr:hypothetical protein [Bradyrhizobium sp.]
ASCSFKIPMICSSVKRLRFMLWSLLGPERTSNWFMPKGQGHAQRRIPDDRLGRSSFDLHKEGAAFHSLMNAFATDGNHSPLM